MKLLSLIFLSTLLFFSCRSKPHPKNDPVTHNELVSYGQRYPAELLPDKLLPGGSYVKYFVSTDTSDATLYICYGKPGFDSVFKKVDGLPGGCDTWEYAYHTSHVIGLTYECANDRRLLVLPLNATDSIRTFSPLFIGIEDSLLLVEDNQQGASGHPALIAADLDFQHRKPFQLSSAVPCADMLACFDTIYFNKRLVMEYEAGEEGQESTTQVQAEALDWKK